MKSFMKIRSFGHLSIDVVLFESYYPILFTCLNENRDLFLCVCCQSNSEGKKWLITKTTPDIVVSVLKNELTLREAFLAFREVQITVCANADGVTVDENDKSAWDSEKSIDLPDKGEFLDAEEGEFDEEILHFEAMKYDVFCEYYIPFGEKEIFLECTKLYPREYDLYVRVSEYFKLIKKLTKKIVLSEYENDDISYEQIYEKVEKKVLTKNLVYDEYISTEVNIKEMPQAA